MPTQNNVIWISFKTETTNSTSQRNQPKFWWCSFLPMRWLIVCRKFLRKSGLIIGLICQWQKKIMNFFHEMVICHLYIRFVMKIKWNTSNLIETPIKFNWMFASSSKIIYPKWLKWPPNHGWQHRKHSNSEDCSLLLK